VILLALLPTYEPVLQTTSALDPRYAAQLGQFLAQPRELLALIGGQQVGAEAAVGLALGLTDPGT
jgi:hypothetical protein